MGRTPYRWTRELRAECRKLYEGGMHADDLARRYDVQPATIRSMASRFEWKRKHRAEARPQPERNANPSLAASPSDVQFNHKIADTIRSFWRAKGQAVEVRVEGLGVRSRTIGGLPVSAQQAKRQRLDGWC
jgi:transposase